MNDKIRKSCIRKRCIGKRIGLHFYKIFFKKRRQLKEINDTSEYILNKLKDIESSVLFIQGKITSYYEKKSKDNEYDKFKK